MHEEVQFEPIDSSVTRFQGLYLPCLGVFLHALSMVFGVRKGPRLGFLDQAKAEDVGKGGRQTVDRHLQGWGGQGTCIASTALIPRETPMSALCSGDDLLADRPCVIFA